jgi:uncharacterized protein YcbX
MISVGNIWRYPIKSCAGESVSRVKVMSYGLEHDRRCMIVDSEGKFISQREHPHLCLVKTRILNGVLYWRGEHTSEMKLELCCLLGKAREVEVWGMKFNALDLGDQYAAWFSDYLSTPCRLVAVPDTMMRTRQIQGVGVMNVACQDSSPIHIVTQASLWDLDRRIWGHKEKIENPIDVRRFRPNLLLIGNVAYEEETWQSLKIGDQVLLQRRKNTERCKIVNIKPGTGEIIPGTYRTLAKFKKNNEGKATFGVHFVPMALGEIIAGQLVTA